MYKNKNIFKSKLKLNCKHSVKNKNKIKSTIHKWQNSESRRKGKTILNRLWIEQRTRKTFSNDKIRSINCYNLKMNPVTLKVKHIVTIASIPIE